MEPQATDSTSNKDIAQIERKYDIKPVFDLRTPNVCKEVAALFLNIQKKEITDPQTNELIDAQIKRVEILFDEAEGNGGDVSRKSLVDLLKLKIKGGDGDKKDLLSDLNFLNSLYAKVDSWKDQLTGLYNRRGFQEMARLLTEHPDLVFGEDAEKIKERGYSLLMMDIDDLKDINDKLGHKKGDEAILEISNAIQKSVRSTDPILRLSGDEILIFILHTDMENIRKLDGTIVGRVAQIRLGSGDSERGMTYSAGADNHRSWEDLSEMAHSDDPMAISRLLHNADRALYVAKNSGRNQIKFANGE